MQRLRAQAIIEWKNEDVKKAYEAGLKAHAQRATGLMARAEPDGVDRLA